MKNILIHGCVFLVVGSVLHGAWEFFHLPLYRDYNAMGGPLSVVVYATLGDVLYMTIALALVSLFKGQAGWFMRVNTADYVGLALFGFMIALFVEYKAQALGLWSYTENMPLLSTLGISPLLQMFVLLPLSVFITVRVVSFFRQK